MDAQNVILSTTNYEILSHVLQIPVNMFIIKIK